MTAAVRGIWGAAVVAACAAPSAAANVWPRVSQMWAEGAASGTEVGLTLALAMSAVGMAAVPFAMKKAGNIGFWLVCLMMGLWVSLIGFSSSEQLHRCLHPDSGELNHDCLVTSIAKSQSLFLVPRANCPVPEFFEVGRASARRVDGEGLLDLRLDPSRAPPFLFVSLV